MEINLKKVIVHSKKIIGFMGKKLFLSRETAVKKA